MPTYDPAIPLEKAMELATIAHQGQKYGQNEDYIHHPFRVASHLRDPHLKVIAFLHDVVEDTEVTLDQIRAEFGEDVAQAIDALSRRPKESYLLAYIPRLCENAMARAVKIEDLKENIHYAKNVNKEYAYLLPRYEKALRIIRDVENKLTAPLVMPPQEPSIDFTGAFNEVQRRIHDNAVAHGWWETERNEAEVIALCHSELSEALEAMRHGNPASDKIPEFSGVEEELADVIIRIMDWAQGKELNISGAILSKMEYNKNRPYKHGNKKF